MASDLAIEVAYATPEKQLIVPCLVEPGTAPRQAIRLSGINAHFPEIDVEHCAIGVFGKAIADDYALRPGDRIEIYRPLLADPREVRRQRAARGLKTGKGGGAIEAD